MFNRKYISKWSTFQLLPECIFCVELLAFQNRELMGKKNSAPSRETAPIQRKDDDHHQLHDKEWPTKGFLRPKFLAEPKQKGTWMISWS